MRIRVEDLSEQEKIETLDALYTAAGTIQGRDTMKLFLRDLLTESERIMLGRRILIARALIDGHSYPDIAETMRVGFDTIRRVDRWLEDQVSGYEKAIQGLKKVHQKRLNNKINTQSPLYQLKKKYPLHFILFAWPKKQKTPATYHKK